MCPVVVVLDNAGIHTSKVVKATLPGPATLGVYLNYPPPCSPELNRIEPVFKQVKHHDMPTRSFTRADLRKAVDGGFDPCRRLRINCDSEPRLAAQWEGWTGRVAAEQFGVDRVTAPKLFQRLVDQFAQLRGRVRSSNDTLVDHTR